MKRLTLLFLAVAGIGSLFPADAETATFTWLGDSLSFATAVTTDGSVVVGTFIRPQKGAFRWTAETGMVMLGNLGEFSLGDGPNTMVGRLPSRLTETSSLVTVQRIVGRRPLYGTLITA